MAKKSSTRKSLKSLFSRSEATLDGPLEKDPSKNEGEKRKLKFLRFRRKPKSGSAPEKSASESQRVLGAAEPSNTAEDGDASADNIVSDNKKVSLYGTASRSKGKQLSYSELDLRRPKKFATFSFGRGKKKKKDEENISKSTFGLHSPGIEQQEAAEETPLDLSQMELDRANMKTISMSQPDLDTSDAFDIPSPPPVATNQSGFCFANPNQSQSFVPISTQSESKEPLTNGPDLLDVHEETPEAPSASIPELQLDEEKSSIPAPVAESSAPMTDRQSADTQAAPRLPASQPQIAPDTSDHKVAAGGSVSASGGPRDNDNLQQSRTKTETPLTELTRDTLSYHQADAPDIADSTAQSGEPSPTSVDSKADATAIESTSVHHCDDDNSALGAASASVHEGVSVSRTERSAQAAGGSVTTTSAVSGEKETRPYIQDAVYGALYESLFPRSFTSEIASSLSNPPYQICAETRRLNTKSEPVVIKTFSECHTETDVMYPRLPSSRDSAACRADDAKSSHTDISASSEVVSPNESSRSSSYQSSAVTDPRADTDIRCRYLPSSLRSASEAVGKDIPYSELIRSHSEVKSDSFSLIRDRLGSAPAVQSPAPPFPDYVTSLGTDTQVTDSKRRVILVKELVTDEASADSGCPSAALNKMSGLETKIDTVESFYSDSGSGMTEGCEGPLSPAYLSMGSDDGSAVEIFFSAEEDNAEESGEEGMHTMIEREEVCATDGMKEMEQGEIEERGRSERDEGDLRAASAEMRTDGDGMGNEKNKGDLSSQTEVQGQMRGQRAGTRTSEFVGSNDAMNQAEEVATTALPRRKEEGEEGREEELPATPVPQVNTLVVCEVAPPSSELHVQGEWSEENCNEHLETEDHLCGEEQLPSREVQYLAREDLRSSVYAHAAPGNTREEDVSTPTIRRAEEQVSVTADKRGEASGESAGTNINATTSAVTDTSAGAEVVGGTELQSDATETEHNRAKCSGEWVDTLTRSTDRDETVELSTPDSDPRRPDTEPAEAPSERPGHPAEAQPDLNQGSLTVARTNSAALEVPAPEIQQTKADKESVDKMSSGYSSLSTTLTMRNSSPPKEDESKQRFHKVSLINEADGTGYDTEEFGETSTTATESNGADLGSEYRWRNRFEGVSQYKPHKPEDSSFSDSLRYRMPDAYSSYSPLSSSFALSEVTAHKNISDSLSSSSFPSSQKHLTLADRLKDRMGVYLSHESEPAGEPNYECRRSSVEWEEPAAPAGEGEGRREGEAESERIKSRWESHQLPVSGFSSALQTSHADGFEEDDGDESSRFTGLFKATLVELVSDPAGPPSTPPASPEADTSNQFDMDSLMDTLKSMGPSMRPRNLGQRAPPQALVSSLPPIVEDAPSPVTSNVSASLASPKKKTETTGSPADSPNEVFTLPTDLGLKRNTTRDTRSPLELMKQNQQDQQLPSGTRGMNMPLRASATNSIVMSKSTDSSPDDLKSPMLNGNGVLSPNTGSRLDNSVLFGNYRSSSLDPETGPLRDRMNAGLREPSEPGTGKDPAGSRFERFSFFWNSTSSSLDSLTGAEDPKARMSLPPPLGVTSPPSSSSPTRLLSPTGSVDLQRPFVTADSPLIFVWPETLQWRGRHGVQQTSLFNSVHGGSQFQSKEPEPDRNLVLKYRAFPDAYLTKEKEHGKLNPRPGKMYIFDRPGMCGQRIEVRSDIIDATPWELQETISIRVVRGGWVLYEKPNFKGEKIALDEEDIELTYPFGPPEEKLQNGPKEGEQQNGETGDEQSETKPARRFIIGSLRRAVRDYSVPEISLFPEENAEGKKVIFRDTSDDARIFGFPIKATSIIINAGLWLVFAQPFFQGVPRVLEVGGYSNPASWGVEQPYVGSLHPLKVGEPRVENMSEPKVVIYDKPYFSGKSRTITANTRDFMTRTERQQSAFMYSVGSLKVLGGIWVGYEKEGFRGHQYLLEEGEYHDWRVWGGHNAELRSVRVIRADLMEPLMVMFEQPEEEQEGMQENTFEVTEAIPDVELFDYKTSTRSIHVVSGAWIAYSHVDFSGNQYILEKGFYNNCADWGSQDTRICSVQPILMAPSDGSTTRSKIILYSEPDFHGECHIFDRNQEVVSEKLTVKSCRVAGGSWVIYENQQYSGNLYVLSEGDYPNLTSMGCPPDCSIRSVRVVPMTFSVPSISLFGLEGLEGREITTDTEVLSMAEEGINSHILSVRVNTGCWVICEHSNYRGRQFLLEPIEIPNWPKFSSLNTIGSMYPVRQRRHFFRIKNKKMGLFMSVQGGVEEMKTGRVLVTEKVEAMSDIWFYQDGLIKNKLSQSMCLQVMGNIEPAAKLVLWTETRQPIQTWKAQMRGLITSLTFPGMVLDVKGGKTYDKDHVVIMPENEERPSQQWEIELL